MKHIALSNQVHFSKIYISQNSSEIEISQIGKDTTIIIRQIRLSRKTDNIIHTQKIFKTKNRRNEQIKRTLHIVDKP